jgi:hypothetical protein
MARNGYLFVDHRASPGMPGSKLFGEGTVYEADTEWCCHCSVVVVKNPDRFRSRGHCPRCDKYICDVCAVAYRQNGICRPFAQVVDELKSGKTLFPVLAKNIEG